MTTTKMFTRPAIGRLAVSLLVAVAMHSAPFCLGIAACKCVGVMYSRGMRAHMAAITQTHKAHVVMQQELRARSELGAGPIGSLSSGNQACDASLNSSRPWIFSFGTSYYSDYFLLLLERVSYWPNSRTDWIHMDLYGESVYEPHAAFPSFCVYMATHRETFMFSSQYVRHILVFRLSMMSYYLQCLPFTVQTHFKSTVAAVTQLDSKWFWFYYLGGDCQLTSPHLCCY